MKIDNIHITIFGLGHIGLPTAALFADKGLSVIGVDINKQIVDHINSGKSHISEPGLDELVQKAIYSGNLVATDDGISASKNSEVKIVIVPTPVDEYKNADLSAVISACKMISKTIKKDNLIIIESTVPQGTCENIVIPILEKSGLEAGKDFSIVYIPERAIPNSTIYEMKHNPRVIGGIDKKSTERAASLYKKIIKGKIIKVKNLVTAETIKLIENTYRDVNIALANELAVICENLNVDAIEAIEAANYHPRVNIHTPGPGVGGHCIPIDPYFIVETAEKNGLNADIIKTARIVNERMPFHVTDLISEALNEAGKSIENAKIGILGVAYKGNVADIRETPVKPLINSLKDLCEELYAHDPYANQEAIKSFGIKPVSMKEIFECDCVVIITDHDQYKHIKPEMIKNNVLVCTRPILNPDKFINEGIIFKGVGRITKSINTKELTKVKGESVEKILN